MSSDSDRIDAFQRQLMTDMMNASPGGTWRNSPFPLSQPGVATGGLIGLLIGLLFGSRR